MAKLLPHFTPIREAEGQGTFTLLLTWKKNVLIDLMGKYNYVLIEHNRNWNWSKFNWLKQKMSYCPDCCTFNFLAAICSFFAACMIFVHSKNCMHPILKIRYVHVIFQVLFTSLLWQSHDPAFGWGWRDVPKRCVPIRIFWDPWWP